MIRNIRFSFAISNVQLTISFISLRFNSKLSGNTTSFFQIHDVFSQSFLSNCSLNWLGRRCVGKFFHFCIFVYLLCSRRWIETLWVEDEISLLGDNIEKGDNRNIETKEWGKKWELDDMKRNRAWNWINIRFVWLVMVTSALNIKIIHFFPFHHFLQKYDFLSFHFFSCSQKSPFRSEYNIQVLEK